jgi:hypothetical protein
MDEILNKSIQLTKAWGDTVAFYEGWLSKDSVDEDRHIIDPEAFSSAMDSYFERRAPVSFIHDGGKRLPAGHLQKAAIIKEGQVIKSASHPTDPADFEALPSTGNGVYVRGIANNPDVALALKSGNVGGLSFQAMATGEKRADGTKYFGPNSISFWKESTVAPYPKNPDAAILLTKANTENQMDETKLAALLESKFNEFLEKAKPSTPPAPSTPPVNVEELITKAKEELTKSFEEKLEKAQTLTRGEPAQQKGSITPSNTPSTDRNLITELLEKAEKKEPYTEDDMFVLERLTFKALSDGLKD